MKKIVEKLTAKKNLMVENIKDKKGFTLIELIVVMAIMAILVLVAAPMFLNYTKDAAVTQLTQDARVLSDGAFQYNINNERWPVGETPDMLAAGDADFITATLVTAVEGGEVVEDLVATDLAVINAEELNDYVSSTSNPISEYVLAVKGEHEGTVFHLEGQEDRDGNVYHGLEAVELETNVTE